MANVKLCCLLALVLSDKVHISSTASFTRSKFTIRNDVRVSSGIFRSTVVSSRGRCVVDCDSMSGCRTINYHTPTRTCELLTGYVTLSTSTDAASDWVLMYKEKTCDNRNWIPQRKTCYKIEVHGLLNYMSAKTKCQSFGGNLIKIATMDDLAVINKFADSFGLGIFWTSAAMHNDEGWHWYDGTPVMPFVWRPHGTEYSGCGDMVKWGGKYQPHRLNKIDWRDCGRKTFSYICEKEPRF